MYAWHRTSRAHCTYAHMHIYKAFTSVLLSLSLVLSGSVAVVYVVVAVADVVVIVAAVVVVLEVRRCCCCRLHLFQFVFSSFRAIKIEEDH